MDDHIPAPPSPGADRTRYVELNHVLENGMPVYPGFPAPSFGAIVSHKDSRARYADKAEFYLGKVEMPGNLGTYIDAPFHRFAHLDDLSLVPLDAVAGLDGVVVDAPTSPRAIDVELDDEPVRGRAVLIRTGWDARWGTERYWEPGPFLADPFVERLIASGVKLVGVDFWNIDDTEDPVRPAHTGLLRAGILVVEHLCGLDALPTAGFRFYAVPLRITKGASFPVRAFAEIPEG